MFPQDSMGLSWTYKGEVTKEMFLVKGLGVCTCFKKEGLQIMKQKSNETLMQTINKRTENIKIPSGVCR